MSGFNRINSLSTDLVNCLNVDIETKRLLRENVLKLVMVSCQLHEKDPTFKEEIDNLALYFQLKE